MCPTLALAALCVAQFAVADVVQMAKWLGREGDPSLSSNRRIVCHPGALNSAVFRVSPQGALADVAQMIGVATIAMMATSRFAFEYLGWRGETWA